jgi:hypothetical protein
MRSSKEPFILREAELHEVLPQLTMTMTRTYSFRLSKRLVLAAEMCCRYFCCNGRYFPVRTQGEAFTVHEYRLPRDFSLLFCATKDFS